MVLVKGKSLKPEHIKAAKELINSSANEAIDPDTFVALESFWVYLSKRLPDEVRTMIEDEESD